MHIFSDSDSDINSDAIDHILSVLNHSLSIKDIHIRKQGLIHDDLIHEYDLNDIIHTNSNMIEALYDIRQLFDMRQTMNTSLSSYSLIQMINTCRELHNREPLIIYPGEFIACMVAMGYQYRAIYYDNILHHNVYFNVSTKKWHKIMNKI